MSEENTITNEVKATIQEIADTQITSKVVTEKNEVPRVVTIVKFEYIGRPSAMEPILELAAKGRPIHVKFYSPQLTFLEEKQEG